MIVDQIPKRKLSLWGLLSYLIGFQATVLLTGYLSTLIDWASFIGWALLLALGFGFYQFLQEGIVSFEIKWIDNALHLERILSRGNHVYIVVQGEEIVSLNRGCVAHAISNTQWFCHRKGEGEVYSLKTIQGKTYVIKPSELLKKAIEEVLNAKSTL